MMKCYKKFKAIIIFVFLSSFSASVPESGYFIPKRAASIYSCDLDGDNFNDLITGHLTESDSNTAISLLNNISNGEFILYDTTHRFNGYVENIFATLMNNDTYPDIIAEHAADSSGTWKFYVRVLYNDGNGNFPIVKDFLHTGPNVFTGIKCGDINGDLHQDIVIIVNYGLYKYWGVFYNDGLGNLLPPVYYDLSFFPQDLSVGDLNNDGRDDILIAGNTEILYSLPSGFQSQSLNGTFTTLCNIADMDHDGQKDVIGINGLFGSTTVQVFNGAQNFSKAANLLYTFGSYHSLVADMNNDSLPEILLLPYTDDGVYILYNTGSFTFDSMQFIPITNVGENRRYLTSADLDGNGFNDIAIVRDIGGTGSSIQNLIILFNDGQGHFVPDPITSTPNNSNEPSALIYLFPNPFHKKINYVISTPDNERLELSIINIMGEIVKHENLGVRANKRQSFYWDGISDNNVTSPDGIYFIVVCKKGKPVCTKKIIKY